MSSLVDMEGLARSQMAEQQCNVMSPLTTIEDSTSDIPSIMQGFPTRAMHCKLCVAIQQ
jgi:hypothetical protein